MRNRKRLERTPENEALSAQVAMSKLVPWVHLHTGIWKAENSLRRGWKGVNVNPLRHHTKSAEAQSDTDTNTLSKSSLSTARPSASLATQSLLHFRALKWSFLRNCFLNLPQLLLSVNFPINARFLSILVAFIHRRNWTVMNFQMYVAALFPGQKWQKTFICMLVILWKNYRPIFLFMQALVNKNLF